MNGAATVDDTKTEEQEPTYRLSFNAVARHRAWLKRKALERELEDGGHSGMSHVLFDVLEDAMARDNGGSHDS